MTSNARSEKGRTGTKARQQYAIIVTFELEDGAAARFRHLVAENARKSVAQETGCLRFDVLFPTDGASPHDVVLYEIYTDPAAFDLHLASAHFKSFDEETRTLVRRKTVTAYAVDQNAKA